LTIPGIPLVEVSWDKTQNTTWSITYYNILFSYYPPYS
jgi:hypothetical protein